MKKENVHYIKEMAYYSSIGLSVVLSTVIGLALGVWLDGKFGTRPLWTLVFLGLGVLAGFKNIGLAIKKSRNF